MPDITYKLPDVRALRNIRYINYIFKTLRFNFAALSWFIYYINNIGNI